MDMLLKVSLIYISKCHIWVASPPRKPHNKEIQKNTLLINDSLSSPFIVEWSSICWISCRVNESAYAISPNP
ncbi:hypothetical protein RclHR1_00060006 [Rhizophagus clarus]|uniref:Uncharacterized protein n=1 Tax=Rhizophagus clarus TaxID=94130 RepID=A0A2Z6RVW3_9GLOM|nr:hypothetical protein RclHR1_00060006 [Rhizophagus clarus]